MRREGVIIVGIGLLLLLLSANYYHIFNALALFLLVGGIDGTKFSLPDSVMFGFSFLALIGLIAWPFRDALGEKLASKKLAKPLRSKRPQV